MGGRVVFALALLATGCASLSGLSGGSDDETASAPPPAAPVAPKPSATPTDTPPASAARCDPAKPFGTPTTLTVGVTDEFGARHDAKESQILLTRRDGADKPIIVGGATLATATPALFTILNNAGPVEYPTLAPDGLSLYAAVKDGAQHSIYRATRIDPQGVFVNVARVETMNDALSHRYPYLPTSGTSLYWTDSDGAGISQIMRAELPNLQKAAQILADAPASHPVVTRDEGTLYYAKNVGGTNQIFRATANGNQFHPTSPGVPVVATIRDVEPTWISDDDCVLIFQIDSGATRRSLMQATRPQ